MLRDTLNISEELHKKLELELKGEHEINEAVSNIAPNEVNVLVQEQDKPTKTAVAMPISKIVESSRKTQSDKLKQMKIKKFVTLAKEKYKLKNYPEALKYLTKGLDVDPKNQELLFFIKKVNIKLKKAGRELDRAKTKLKDTVDTNQMVSDSISEVKVTEKITIPRSAQKKTEPKVAVPIGNLNGASISDEPFENLKNDPTDNNKETQTVFDQETKAMESIMEEQKKKSLSQSNKPKCISCNGTGSCYWCSGSGKCDRCGGSGTYNDEPCTMCNGSGKCNSCAGNGYCMWCRGKGIGKQMNTLFSKND
jgi:hypothetical protein